MNAPGEIIITPLAESEYPLAAEIIAQSVRAFWPGHYPPAVIDTVAEQNTPDWIRRRSSGQEDYLARRDGVPAGYMALKQNEIGHLFVHPNAAGHGVGSALVAFGLGRLRERGHRSAKVYAGRNATGFYEKQGFRRTGEKTFELRPGIFLASVLMERAL